MLLNNTVKCIRASGNALSIQKLHYYIGHCTALSQRGAANTLWCDHRTTATMLLYTEEPTIDHKALRSRRHERLPLRQTISMMWCSMACGMWATLRTVRSCAEPRVQAVSPVGTLLALGVLAVDYARIVSYPIVSARQVSVSMCFFGRFVEAIHL